ncbi:MAG: phosphoribosylformylglycinamidine synthase subunit PurQ, partial [Syntrophaceae bacterium]|nr:phosphoribosylformylglycinamidine synthase subunit PurQ [Syntrophaceae bacterium]
MARTVKTIVLTGNGTNCEMEMAHACRLAGSDVVDIVHISELLCGEKRLSDYHFLNLPGGFLDGDDLGSAKAGANRFIHATIRGSREKLYGQLVDFIRDGKLILGVCNGFQLMIKLGLLP